MATYTELRSLFASGDLPDRTEVAVVIKAHAILQEAGPSVDRLAWAEGVLANSQAEGRKLLKYVLAANSGQTVATIQGASDDALQTHVSAAVDKLHP